MFTVGYVFCCLSRFSILDCLDYDSINERGVRMKKSNIQQFADTIKDNPKKIIAWAKREIREYEKLIKILERKK